MSLIDNLRGPKSPHAMKAPEVKRRLEFAEAELAELEAQHGAAALDAINGDAGADARYADIQKRLASARENVATLKAAHKAAVDRDEATIRAQRASLQKTQMNSVRQHLAARDAAAVALSAAIAEAAKQYHVLLERSAKAQAACPIATEWPGGSMCEQDPLVKLVEHELFRLSASPGNKDGHAFPGAQLPGLEFEWNPAAVPALPDEIKRASAHVVATLTGTPE